MAENSIIQKAFKKDCIFSTVGVSDGRLKINKNQVEIRSPGDQKILKNIELIN